MWLDILKDFLPVIVPCFFTVFLAITKFVWNILQKVRDIDNKLNFILEDYREMKKDNQITKDRVAVHDQIASIIFGTSVNSKMILDERQDYPVFHTFSKKPRHDH